MARNKTNMFMNGFGGAIGKQMLVRTRGGRTYLGKMPASNPLLKASEQQAVTRLKFRDCVLFAKGVKDNPELKARYAAAAKPYQTFANVAFADAFKAPVIENLRAEAYSGSVGERIVVKVTDNFSVANVTISIYDPQGNLLEQGLAIQEQNLIDWTYTTSQLNPATVGSLIRVSASDIPGNQVTLDQQL
ncbi:hypothetical protein [Flavihumibacter sp.]|uniref:hypothetical protein n=1 Tax=Flavihumibacter sp. TaxID=1913981 RepID=UPI002FC8550B